MSDVPDIKIIRTEIEVLPADEPETIEDEIFIDHKGDLKKRRKPWTFSEGIGVGVYNPRGLEQLELILGEKDDK